MERRIFYHCRDNHRRQAFSEADDIVEGLCRKVSEQEYSVVVSFKVRKHFADIRYQLRPFLLRYNFGYDVEMARRYRFHSFAISLVAVGCHSGCRYEIVCQASEGGYGHDYGWLDCLYDCFHIAKAFHCPYGCASKL